MTNRLVCHQCGLARSATSVITHNEPICATCFRNYVTRQMHDMGADLHRLTPEEWDEYVVLRGMAARRIELDDQQTQRMGEIVGLIVEQVQLSDAEDAAARRILSLALEGWSA